ncbi:hypothetical protein VK792_17080 [Mesobacterium sp. TK19101]|uniref:Transposase n=1 Tax=Mesobacterium hydrothermale TaxID=3111907 RepID=A0ABU6HKM4_9RHOB|nr:hypothetical protein [Mesobacterium sp. TK19101]
MTDLLLVSARGVTRGRRSEASLLPEAASDWRENFADIADFCLQTFAKLRKYGWFLRKIWEFANF